MDRLESDLLRTFLAVAETGSITLGAARILRTQSAASLQVKRLEETLGQPVFHRHGRGVTLTPLGEQLLPVARDVTRTLDTALRRFSTETLGGRLRLGLPDDHNPDILVEVAAEFARAYPGVELEVTCDLSVRFPDMMARGLLDLAVYEVAAPEDGEEVL